MFYHEFDAGPDVASHVSNYWWLTVSDKIPPAYAHQIVPDGCVSVAFTYRAHVGFAAVVGPRATPFTVPVYPGDRFVGVRFWPDAGVGTLGESPGALKGVIGPADHFAPRAAWIAPLGRALAACDRPESARVVLDARLSPAVTGVPLDGVARAAVVALIATRGEMPIPDVAAGVGVGVRQLERRFGKAVGLTPKQFARIRRVRIAAAQLLESAPRTWSAVAAELGFADHAHLTREFRELAGLTPRELARRVQRITCGHVRP